MYKLLHKTDKENTLGNNPAVTNCCCTRDNRMRFQHPISDTAFLLAEFCALSISYWKGH